MHTTIGENISKRKREENKEGPFQLEDEEGGAKRRQKQTRNTKSWRGHYEWGTSLPKLVKR